jgi:pimeloyl-ACP methyl ester carboxylesterase
MKRELVVAEGALRVFDRNQWSLLREKDATSDDDFDRIALLSAPLSGALRLLHRDRSTERQRRCRSFRAYLCNHGLRDIWQAVFDRRAHRGCGEPPSLWRRGLQQLRNALNFATHAGEVRLFEYALKVDWNIAGGRIDPGARLDTSAFAQDAPIVGRKRLTYGRRSNPWRQLMRMALVAFPGLEQKDAVLELDTNYLAREGVPLLHLVGQRDQPTALADLASFAAYFLRLLLTIHVWSFRGPDAPPPREPQRLPGVVEGLPPPEIRELDMDYLPSGLCVRVRLTRYRPSNAKGLPVVLIHGYSASGTTFAHPAVRPNLAEHLCKGGRDVWILDLRTSSGMPTGNYPWTFEDAALNDLPAAIDLILRETCSTRVDVFAHCMGAAMFSMAVLAPPAPGDRFFREREDLPNRICRAVLSQIGPVMVLSPANIFRGYVMSYLRYFLPRADYEFRVPPDPGVLDQILDRLLATLPYPEEEFDIENPRWPCKRAPFVGTRHRMDALYGRAFSVAGKDGKPRLDDKVLEYIDDLFGPLSIDTVAQTIHFAREQAVTDPTGRGYVTRPGVVERWKFPTLSIHGEENGLSDVATLARMEEIVGRDGRARLETLAFPGFGHQDSMIGKDAEVVFRAASEFLSRE